MPKTKRKSKNRHKPYVSALVYHYGGRYIDCINTTIEHLSKYRVGVIELSNCFIGTHGAVLLANALETNTHLTSLVGLHLHQNAIGDGGIAAICNAIQRSPHLASLEVLFLGQNEIGHNGITALAGCIEHPTQPLGNLSHLYLQTNSIGDDGATILFNAITQPTQPRNLTTIDLSGNRIGDVGAAAIANRFTTHPTSIEVLYLESNFIGNDGAVAIASILTSIPRIRISLEINPFGGTGIDAIANAVERSDIGYISLCYPDQMAIDDAVTKRNQRKRRKRMAALFSVIQLQPPNFLLDYNTFRIVQPFLV